MLCERCMTLHAEEEPRQVRMVLSKNSETLWPGLCGRCSVELFARAPGLRIEYQPALVIMEGEGK